MKKLNIDTGVEEFSVNGQGVLRFNPADPNLYHRFFAAGRTLNDYDAALTKALQTVEGDKGAGSAGRRRAAARCGGAGPAERVRRQNQGAADRHLWPRERL